MRALPPGSKRVFRAWVGVVWLVLCGCGERAMLAPQPHPDGGRVAGIPNPEFKVPRNRIAFVRDAGLTDERNGDRLEKALESLRAGDLLVIAAGRYVVSGRLAVRARGTEQDPIVIRAAAGADVHIHRAGADQNLMDVEYARYLTIEGIEFSGGDRGIRFIDAAHVFFHRNEVHHTGDAAITANEANTHHLYFVANHIHHTRGHGEGFYLGANNAKQVTHHTYVVGNRIHDTGIEDCAGRQGDGIELKTGSYACVIAGNVVENTNYPGILVYGNGGRPERNVIERNVIVNSAEAGIQVAADAIVRNNLILDCDDACIVSQTHQDAKPRNLTIVHNTLVNAGTCLKVSSWDGANIVFANNALYSARGAAYRGGYPSGTRVSNVVLPDLAAFVELTLDGKKRDATPSAGSPLVGAGDAAHGVEDDLRGKARSGSLDAGCVDAAE